MEIRNNYVSIEQMQNQFLNKNSAEKKIEKSGLDFQQILKDKAGLATDSELKFSKHADARLSERNINLTDEQIERLNDGTKKASEKGIKESLMIMDDLAFIVNVKNNIVVTAMDSNNSNEKVFTNIDGAVIV